MNAITPTQPKPEIVKFREQLETRAAELKMALPAHISPDKFQRTVVTAVQQNPDLLGADRQSLVLACMKAAQDGLLPDGREAALVIFNENKKVDGAWVQRQLCQYLPMVYGLRKKIFQARDADGKPIVSALEVAVVYRAEVEAGHFIYRTDTDPPLRHKPMLELTAEQTEDGEIVAAYSIATMADGTKSYELMRRFEIDRVRDTSKTGATKDRYGKPRTPKGPWVEWFAEMAKKTVLRRHSKTLPMSGDIIIEIQDEEGELEAGVSATALLARQPGGQPEAIEDHTDDTPHDLETGEIIEGTATAEPEPEVETPADDAGEPAQVEADTNVNDQAEPEPTLEEDYGTAPVGQQTLLDEVTANPQQPGDDPAAAKANEIIGELTAASSIAEITAVWGRNAGHLQAMEGTALHAQLVQTKELRLAEIKAAPVA